MTKRLTALLVAAFMLVCCIPALASEGPDDTTNHEHFTVYYNYSAWNHVFGEDEYSAFLAEKLRKAIEASTLITQQRVTCSFGVTEMVPGEDPKSLIARADKALYSSKESGRNRVTVATFRRSH